MRIFVSSTFEDLKEHRAAAIRGLHQLGHEVVAMEYFTADSLPPVQAVLEKVGRSEAYVGIFAWRYGYVPHDDTAYVGVEALPPGGIQKVTSITHLEYLEAKELDKPRLVFLLDEDSSWPPQKIDAFVGEGGGSRKAPGSAIRELRQQLQGERVVSYFNSPADVEARVTTAVANLGMSRGLKNNLLHLTSPVPQAPVLDSSYGSSIQTEIVEASKTGKRVSTIDIATEWWSTRLCRFAALAREFTDIKRVVIVESQEFVGMLSISTIIDRVEATDPRLARYNANLREIVQKSRDQQTALDVAEARWNTLLPRDYESAHKASVTRPNLAFWFGDSMLTGTIEVGGDGQATLIDLIRIIAYPNDFVPVHAKRLSLDGFDARRKRDEPTWEDAPIQLIDKRALNERLAQQYLEELMDKARLN